MLDLTQIVKREIDSQCTDVLIKAIKLAGTRYGNDPRRPRKEPGECDLSRCCSLLFSDPGKQINHHLVCFPRFWRVTREGTSDIGTGEGCVLAHLSREIPPTQRAVWHEADTEFLTCRKHFLLNVSPPQ